MNLRPFRRRIRLLRASRCGAIGGCVGAGAALLLAVLDARGALTLAPWLLFSPAILGVALGVAWALVERMPDARVARSLDRRGGLEDRLTTAAEVPADTGALAAAQHADAAERLKSLRPAEVYPLRPNRWHGSTVGLLALTALVFAAGNTDLFRTPERRREAEEVRRMAARVEQVARPILAQAKTPDASAEEKDLARRLQKLTRDMGRARVTRAEALVKANALAEQARRAEAQRSAALAESVKGAQTAAEKLAQAQQTAALPKSEEAKMARRASDLERQIAEARDRLAKGQNGKPGEQMSDAERKALEKQMAAMEKELQQLKLSLQAQKMLADLAANEDFQEAQRLLAELAKQSGASAGQSKPLTAEQLEEMARRLEELAKKLDTDEKLAEYARQLREAAKNARLCKDGQCSSALLGACGLGGFSMGAQKGAGGPSRDTWIGDHGTLPRDDKSALLNVKFEDRVLTSQRGDKGPETYQETLGPSRMGGKSAVPYQEMLPKYERSAESAMKKENIPPGERARVRDYFDSLRQ